MKIKLIQKSEFAELNDKIHLFMQGKFGDYAEAWATAENCLKNKNTGEIAMPIPDGYVTDGIIEIEHGDPVYFEAPEDLTEFEFVI